MRFVESVKRGDVLERLAARLTRKSAAAINPILQRVIGGLAEPVIFEFGAYDGCVTNRICGWLRPPFSAYYAWEPDPRNLARIRKNGLPKGVELVEAAVGATDGRTTLHLSSGNSGNQQEIHTASSSILRPTREQAKWYPWMHFAEALEVPVRSLDSFCRERRIERIDFIWADIQGAERYMVEGGREILAQTKFMFLEQEAYRNFEGQWSYREMTAALRGRWRVAYRFPNDVLLYNLEQVKPGSF